jgi:cysteinyl-tRNA synthetase
MDVFANEMVADRAAELRCALDKDGGSESKGLHRSGCDEDGAIDAGIEVRMSKDDVELIPGVGFDPAKLEALK